MATTEEIEAAMVAPHLRRRPLAEALVELHGFAVAGRRMRELAESPLVGPALTEGFKAECLRQSEILLAAAAAEAK